MKKSKSDRYKDSPTMKRDEESGKMKAVKKAVSKEPQKESPESGSEGVPPHARHGMDRMALYGKHEQEHFAHDHGKVGDKTEIHKRHQKEISDMHKRHQSEGK